ncbi:hypothetical protein RJ640_002961, partial [Escallonia rubra]
MSRKAVVPVMEEEDRNKRMRYETDERRIKGTVLKPPLDQTKAQGLPFFVFCCGVLVPSPTTNARFSIIVINIMAPAPASISKTLVVKIRRGGPVFIPTVPLKWVPTVPRSSSFSTAASAISSLPESQENERGSGWSRFLLFVPGAISFGLGTWQIFRRQDKVVYTVNKAGATVQIKMLEYRQNKLGMEPLNCNDITTSSKSMEPLEFRRVVLKGVFDEDKPIYVGPRSRSISGVTENGYYLITSLKPIPDNPERELDEVRGRILGRRPLPSIDEAFAEVRREASRRRVMLGEKKEVVTSGEMPMETVALATKNNPSIDKSSGDQRNNQRGGRPWCSHCNKPGHIRDTCWDIHGKPSNRKSRGSNKGKGFQATVEEKNEDTRASSEMNGIYFTKAQLEQLQKLLSQPTGETLDEDKPWDEHEPEPSLQTTKPNVEPSPQTTLPNLESEPMLPLIEHKKILETGGNSRPLLVYSRRKQPLNGDKPKSLQGQESEPIPSPDEKADDYTHHDGTDHSIQKGAENLTEDLDLDLPIALRKGTKTCTQHPISKFVSCEKLSPTFRDDRGELDTLKLYLASEFELKDLGALKYFLGMEVARSKSGITVSQRKYVLDLLRDTGMLGCRPAETPMEPNAKLDIEGGKDVDREQYQRLVGKLIYLSHTRPDIAFAVSVISQFMHSPKKKHLDAVYGVLRYLKGTPGKGLFFKRGDDRMVEIYTDADWAGSSVDRRSTSGYCTYVWGNLVTWRSKKQPVVARSSAEAEFRALAHGICEGIWLRRLLSELKIIKSWPMKLYCDNKAAVNIAQNPVHHDRTKHVEVDRHFIKEKIDDGSVVQIPVLVNRGWVPRSWRDKSLEVSKYDVKLVTKEPISTQESTASSWWRFWSKKPDILEDTILNTEPAYVLANCDLDQVPEVTPVEVVGVVRGSEKPSIFVPANDPSSKQWFYVDVTAIARACGLPEDTVYLEDINDKHNPSNPYPVPKDVNTLIRSSVMPQDHLNYTLT